MTSPITLTVSLPDGWTLHHLEYATPDLPLDDGAAGVILFAVAEGVNGARALDDAIRSFQAEPDILRQVASSSHSYNIGDLADLDQAWWRPFGIVPLHAPSTEPLRDGPTDHDEVLIDLDDARAAVR